MLSGYILRSNKYHYMMRMCYVMGVQNEQMDYKLLYLFMIYFLQNICKMKKLSSCLGK